MGLNAVGLEILDAEPAISAPPVAAHVAAWERHVLDDPNLLGDIAFAVDGPFHLMYPARVKDNIDSFRAAFTRAGVDGVVYYGKKANKSACVTRACAEHGAGVDVSSVGELTAALAQGIRGSELMVTGPAKRDDLIWLAVRHGALIAVDDLGELDRLAALGTSTEPARVLLRVLPTGSSSRFGMTDDEIDSALVRFGLHESVRLAGFSFHLSGYDPVARAEMADAMIERCLHARTLGHPAAIISLGGGFGVDYVNHDAWSAFIEQADPRWFHADKTFDSYYPYHFPTPGAAMLTAILDHQVGPSERVAKRLRDNDIQLAVEPGRALLDHAGFSVFPVRGSKVRHAHGQPYRLLTVDGSSLSLSEQWFDSEYLPDPVLWPTRPDTTPTPTSVGASTCLDSDMLSWRRIPLTRPAEVGDLLVYPNTAGYQMDSNESAFHELPIPPKVVLHDAPSTQDTPVAATARLRWALDTG
ncbi:alanine racemase [Nocardia callitridis]|uniref:Y4yA family PLP-dependent enzyme n=1 Tax=Nocardia callitridis TaxID=648753 RepID=A0ABP9JSW8_9NOCA